jgi:hypothetical protein
MKVVYEPKTRVEPAPSLFAPGMAWQRAAECWALDAGLGSPQAWQVDQRFEAGGMRFVIEWNTNAECWEVNPEASIGVSVADAIDAELTAD